MQKQAVGQIVSSEEDKEETDKNTDTDKKANNVESNKSKENQVAK